MALGERDVNTGAFAPAGADAEIPGFDQANPFGHNHDMCAYVAKAGSVEGAGIGRAVSCLGVEALHWWIGMTGYEFSWLDKDSEADKTRENFRIYVRHYFSFAKAALQIYDEIDSVVSRFFQDAYTDTPARDISNRLLGAAPTTKKIERGMNGDLERASWACSWELSLNRRAPRFASSPKKA